MEGQLPHLDVLNINPISHWLGLWLDMWLFNDAPQLLQQSQAYYEDKVYCMHDVCAWLPYCVQTHRVHLELCGCDIRLWDNHQEGVGIGESPLRRAFLCLAGS
jgi:hypothetical protein